MINMSHNRMERDQLGVAKGISPMEGSVQEEDRESAATERREDAIADYD